MATSVRESRRDTAGRTYCTAGSVRRLPAAFTPCHRGGSGPPLVLLHGFCDTWRTWELVLPALERRHDVLALTLPGHAGGPPLTGEPGEAAFADAIERAMDEAGFALAHVVGNSLGGWLALHLAARGRARTVVAFAPAGGWARGDDAYLDLLRFQASLVEQLRELAPHADAVLATPEGRRRATRELTVAFEHIPAELIAHGLRAMARCDAEPLIDRARRRGAWELDAAAIPCPVRIAWGTEDRLLPWPSAALRFREEWLPQADWIELEGVGHYPQLDVPLVAAELVAGFTS